MVRVAVPGSVGMRIRVYSSFWISYLPSDVSHLFILRRRRDERFSNSPKQEQKNFIQASCAGMLYYVSIIIYLDEINKTYLNARQKQTKSTHHVCPKYRPLATHKAMVEASYCHFTVCILLTIERHNASSRKLLPYYLSVGRQRRRNWIESNRMPSKKSDSHISHIFTRRAICHLTIELTYICTL